MKESFFYNWYKDIHFEYGQWPLWRMGLNLKYIFKSLYHNRLCNPEQENYFLENKKYLISYLKKPKKDSSIHITAIGDMMWLRKGYSSCLSESVKSLVSDSDVLFANLETPIANSPIPEYVYETLNYNAPEDYLKIWSEFKSKKIISICNNHALDQGYQGLVQTREKIIENRMTCVGGPKSGQEFLVQEIKGIRFGIFGTTYGINHSQKINSENYSGIPVEIFGYSQKEPNWKRIEDMIQKMKLEGARIIIMMAHWGYEYEYFPQKLQIDHSHKLIELGVDIILGTSPHVIQPMELVSVNQHDPNCPIQVKRSGTDSSMALVVYSLGNFATVMPTLECKTGLLLNLGIIFGKEGIDFSNLDPNPIITIREKNQSWLDRKVYSLDGLLKKENLSSDQKNKLLYLKKNYLKVIDFKKDIDSNL